MKIVPISGIHALLSLFCLFHPSFSSFIDSIYLTYGSMSYARRLQSECKHYKESVAEGITLEPDELSLLAWHCTIQAPDDSPYDKRVFNILLKLPEDYPMHPPKAYFVSPIFHPNIHFVTGEVCLDILKSRWTPVWNLEVIFFFLHVTTRVFALPSKSF